MLNASLFQLAEGEMRAPDLWRHDRSGALSCGYEGGECAFTWRAEHVARMADTWRKSDTSRAPEQARLFRAVGSRPRSELRYG